MRSNDDLRVHGDLTGPSLFAGPRVKYDKRIWDRKIDTSCSRTCK